jgi:hypothetical protein
LALAALDAGSAFAMRESPTEPARNTIQGMRLILECRLNVQMDSNAISHEARNRGTGAHEPVRCRIVRVRHVAGDRCDRGFARKREGIGKHDRHVIGIRAGRKHRQRSVRIARRLRLLCIGAIERR